MNPIVIEFITCMIQVWVIEYWLLEIICNLMLVICYFICYVLSRIFLHNKPLFQNLYIALSNLFFWGISSGSIR